MTGTRDEIADWIETVQENERRIGNVATPGMLARALLPLVHRAQAEAWNEGYGVAIGTRIAPGGRNPYIENEGAGA